MFIIAYKKIFLTIAGILMVASIVAISVFGLNFGIDFTGGSLVEVSYKNERPSVEKVKSELNKLSIEEFSVRPAGESNYILRTGVINKAQKEKTVNALKTSDDLEVSIERQTTIGPIIGKELTRKAFMAIILAILAIIAYIAFAFRGVSKPVSSWKYGFIAIMALIHDILIPIGIFSMLGYFLGAQINTLFVMAILAILGYSVNDTIVVFDRIRENLNKNKQTNTMENFDLTVGRSIKDTYVRSINTSLTTAIVLLALFIFGAQSTQFFALTLLVGVLAGTYSSLFFAAPLLVFLESRKRVKATKK
ncbi:MAG: protein translocase subunit SecF [Perlabentimonas sp.]